MTTSKFQILVLAKQVPDTRNVEKDAMKEDGTINRSALPTIFNPDDLKALEMALKVKDRIHGAKVTVVTMGPTRAADIIRESLYRGSDDGIVISDRKFAGSDTLATSYALATALKKFDNIKLVFSGRQAIDGDTAQVGPQTAEKLNMPQITYCETLEEVTEDSIVVKRRLDNGCETVRGHFPLLLTVHGNAADCRPRNAVRVISNKKACSPSEAKERNFDINSLPDNIRTKIQEWTADDINANPSRLGFAGSPTKVKNIENVVLSKKENITLTDNENDIDNLMKELIKSHIIG